MKKVHLLYILPALVLALTIHSCGKKSPDPTPVTDNNNGGGNTTDSCETMLCLPGNLSKFFLPTGVWSETWADPTNALNIAFTNGDYENSDVHFTYTCGTNKIGGVSFLNDNNWSAKIRVDTSATHLTFDYSVDAGAGLRVSALGGAEQTLMADGVYHSASIALPAVVPDSVSIPAYFIYSGSVTGSVYNIYVKNAKFIKQ